MAAGNSYCLGINSNVFFLKDNKKAFILWLNAPKVTAYQHRGFRHILSGTKIGRNCEILPNVLMGKKRPDLIDYHIVIGNDCYISTGVTILAPITIGNNVTIAAGAVVTKDVPDNCVVGGIPAKILKMKGDS